MRKRLTGLLAAALAAAALLASCSAGPGTADHVTLDVMGRATDLEKSYMTAVFDRYEKSTGNRLNLIAIPDAEFEAEAARRFGEGDVPDVFMHFHNADLSRFNTAENFLDLSGEEWADDLTDGARNYCTDGEGRLLGLPFWESSVSGCYYNKTLLDSLGLKAATTQAEFDTLCQALTEIGYTPICWPADGCTWMFQFGLDPVFADEPDLLAALNRGEIAYSDIPAVANMVKWIADAAGRGWFGPSYMETGWADIGPVLTSGDAVMTFIWDTWFYTDLGSGGKYTMDDFALMPAFLGTADGGTYEGGNLNMMMVNRNGERAEAAREFLAFCAQPENYNAAFDGISTVSCFKGQTTNIQSPMVTGAAASIAAKERVSTAATRIVGYNADDVAGAVNAMLRGEADVSGCVALMDQYRIEEARAQGFEAFLE